MRVWFSKSGLTNRVEENGWVFVESKAPTAPCALFAGPRRGSRRSTTIQGEWLRCSDEFTPVILEVAEKKDFVDQAAFRRAVVALPVKIGKTRLKYRGLGGDEFVFYLDQSTPPTVNGKPIDYQPEMAFDSPFVQSQWDSGVVTIAKGERRLCWTSMGTSVSDSEMPADPGELNNPAGEPDFK